jgi:SAM-dependent methyltransferase
VATMAVAALYSDLVPYYWLVDPPLDHRDEAASYEKAFETATPRPETLLDLGSGAGNNALHLKRRFRCTLADISPAMLGLSKQQNPECEHVEADMRTLRLGRTFDAVLVHDAVMYMLTEDDLRAAIRTAFVHTRPGGVAVFAPDCFTESFAEAHEVLETDDGTRSMRALEWSWDPDPTDTTYAVEYAFLFRDGLDVKCVHDHHIECLFPKATWVRLFEEEGFRPEMTERNDEGNIDEVFLCRRP